MMVEVHRAKDGATRFLTARRGEHQLTVPAPTRDQVVIEGLTLDCLVRRVAWMFEEMPPPGETRDSAVAFRDEADAFKPLESDIG
jgi:hypothetical protein